MLSSEQNPEVCDATDDDSSNTAGHQICPLPSQSLRIFAILKNNTRHDTGERNHFREHREHFSHH